LGIVYNKFNANRNIKNSFYFTASYRNWKFLSGFEIMKIKLAVFLEFFSQRKRDNCKVFIHVNVEEPEISISGQLSAT